MKELNAKEKAFANEYVINKGNAYQAAIKVGYSERTALHAGDWLNSTPKNDGKRRNLPYKPRLREYIDMKMNEIEAGKVATAQEVWEYLTSVMRGESEASELAVVGTGDGCSEAQIIGKPPSEKERLDAAKTLAKLMNISTEKQHKEQDLRIRKLELEVERLTEEPDETTATNFIDALTNEAGDVWEE